MDFSKLSSTDLGCYWKTTKTVALKDYERSPMCEGSFSVSVSANISKYKSIIISKQTSEKMIENYCIAAPHSDLAKHRFVSCKI